MEQLLPNDFYTFLEELEANNHKDWFDLNRKRYENNVKIPFENLLTKIIQSIQTFDNTIQITAKQAIFRINKDVRFSKDKIPYKTNRSALVSPFGTKDKVFPGLYFEIHAHYISIYSGAYMLDSKQLQRVREDIVDFSSDFLAIIEETQFKKLFGEIRGDKNLRVPNEFKESVIHLPVLYNKNFYVMAKYKFTDMMNLDLVKLVFNHYKAAYPFNKFLERAIIGE